MWRVETRTLKFQESSSSSHKLSQNFANSSPFSVLLCWKSIESAPNSTRRGRKLKQYAKYSFRYHVISGFHNKMLEPQITQYVIEPEIFLYGCNKVQYCRSSREAQSQSLRWLRFDGHRNRLGDYFITVITTAAAATDCGYVFRIDASPPCI